MKSKLIKIMIFKLSIFFFILYSGCSIFFHVNRSILEKNFNLAGEHSKENQYYFMESKILTYALDGTRLHEDIYRLHLKCIPTRSADINENKFTCIKFTLQQGKDLEVTIPELENWSYIFSDLNKDKEELVFGIDYKKFENLKDSQGIKIPIDKVYHIYNTFIDFHAFCDGFAEPTKSDKGIQDLKSIGQKIVHADAFSKPPVNVGNNIVDGSFFQNGEITLEFKGLSIVNDRQCALLEFDSGESSYKMITKITPNLEIQTKGSSHYKGDIYKDLNSNWVQKVTMNEIVVSETILPISPFKINFVYERNIFMHNINKKYRYKELKDE